MYASKNANPSQASAAADSYASGGAVAGATGNKYFLFENVIEANRVNIAYASPNTNTISFFREPLKIPHLLQKPTKYDII